MAIHQIQVAHDEAQDRLLVRLSTTDDCEFRFWLTRRFTKRLWAMLVQMLEWDRAVKQQVDRETRHAVLDMQHQGYSQEADYKTQFQEWCQKRHDTLPCYATVRETGPDHQKSFEVELSIEGEVVGVGSGRSKKEAEQQAAKAALTRLKSPPKEPDSHED